MRNNRPNINETDVIREYKEDKMSITMLSLKYKTSTNCIKDILITNNVEIRSKHENPNKNSEGKYSNPPEGFHYIACCKEDKKEFEDYTNKSGCLTNYIKNITKI